MKRLLAHPFTALAVLLALSAAGCNAFGITGEDDENEVRVTITELSSAADYLIANDGFTYQVTADTEYEGLSGFADLAVNDVIEIEFENTSTTNTRRAREIEAGDYDENNPDDR